MEEIEFYLKDLESRFKGIDKSKYFLSYSGGKDSHFLYWFIKEYLRDDEIKIVSVNTRMEHHEILERMIKYSDLVLLPKMKPHEVVEQYGSPCFSKLQDEYIERYQSGNRKEYVMKVIYGKNKRYNLTPLAREMLLSGNLHKVSNKCCKILKKDVMHEYMKTSGRKPILGVRANESFIRSQVYTSCMTKDGKFTPLYDLSTELLEAIYDKYKIEVPKVYEKVTRTGCMGCPYGNYMKEINKELELLNDNQRNYVRKVFKKSYEVLGV